MVAYALTTKLLSLFTANMFLFSLESVASGPACYLSWLTSVEKDIGTSYALLCYTYDTSSHTNSCFPAATFGLQEVQRLDSAAQASLF